MHTGNEKKTIKVQLTLIVFQLGVFRLQPALLADNYPELIALALNIAEHFAPALIFHVFVAQAVVHCTGESEEIVG